MDERIHQSGSLFSNHSIEKNIRQYNGDSSMELQVKGIPTSFELVQFIPVQASGEVWEAYFTLSEMIFREWDQRGHLPDRAVVKRQLSTASPLFTVQRWLLLDDMFSAVAAAWMSYDTALSPDYESSMDMCQMHISVAPAYRRKKIATHILKHLIDEALREGKKQGESGSG